MPGQPALPIPDLDQRPNHPPTLPPATLTPVLRPFVLATIAVTIVIYALMPQLHRLRVRLIGAKNTRRDRSRA